MPILNIYNLDPNYLNYYDYSAYIKGKALFTQKAVAISSFDISSAICMVVDGDVHYQVSVSAESQTRASTSCGCAVFAKGRVCKHVIASLLALHLYVETEAPKDWKYRMAIALEQTPKPKTAHAKRTKQLVIFGLQGEKYADNSFYFRLLSFRIKSQHWESVFDLEQLTSREELNQRLDRDRSWVHAAEVVNSSLDARTVVNLSFEGIQLYNLMQRMGSYFQGMLEFGNYLPLLARQEAPIFRLTSRNTFKERLRLYNEPKKLEATLMRHEDHLSLEAGIELDDKIFNTIKGSLHVLSTNPAWLLAGNNIVPVENPEAVNLLSYFPMQIPQKDEQEFRERFMQPVLERIPVRGDVVTWQDIQVDPQPRLYLRDDEGVLRAELLFAYSDYEVEANPKADAEQVKAVPGSWDMLRIHRARETEDSFYQLLTDARYGLKRSGSAFPPHVFELRARTHPFDFLLHSIPLLTAAGFEIYGEESLKSAKINRSKPTISLNISSGLDWFDVNATVHFGDQQVPLQDVRRAMRKRERFVKLADGSVGQIPDAWLQKYRKLFDLAEEKDGSLRVRDYHLPLVDTLLAEVDLSTLPEEFKQRRERLRQFDRIQPQPLPAGFTGELRPYQKAGLDWLHFLHDYGFGGCLADDMGLGKTIQVLAFLQSLKEQGKYSAATLLVVPKSLIANWLREAERFTPGLRILEFVGNARRKDTALFDQYDIILTTYGTMLRDVDFLRSYEFLYTILDESQNIKNPLAQSAKAARLLKTRHRLVMTGTPVENNTFELWSQFAFLNPGLLGSLDYFKREFATPIESRAEEDSAVLLRKLVYPFILRRTKQQVAPELPQRTERILYTDFEPAQRKIYNQTRDYYRGMLLGLIDEEGINDVRMKILEGLLRLRQICIHPSLVDAGYHGEAAKFDLLLDTLETLQSEGHKALIFSQFVQSLHLVRAELERRGFRYTYLDGQTINRQKEVDEFQNDPTIPFFLISLKAGGVGLNLTAADYVIHLDPWWNPAVEMQAADRAHRIGQDKPVFVYKIITRGTVEEKILQLQEHKKDLVDQIISAEGSFFKSITRDDVKVLFS